MHNEHCPDEPDRMDRFICHRRYANTDWATAYSEKKRSEFELMQENKVAVRMKKHTVFGGDALRGHTRSHTEHDG